MQCSVFGFHRKARGLNPCTVVTCCIIYIPDILPVRRSSATYGNGTGAILLSDLNCVGSEASLVGCPTSGTQSRVCDHSEDAGVRCGGT